MVPQILSHQAQSHLSRPYNQPDLGTTYAPIIPSYTGVPPLATQGHNRWTPHLPEPQPQASHAPYNHANPGLWPIPPHNPPLPLAPGRSYQEGRLYGQFLVPPNREQGQIHHLSDVLPHHHEHRRSRAWSPTQQSHNRSHSRGLRDRSPGSMSVRASTAPIVEKWQADVATSHQDYSWRSRSPSTGSTTTIPASMHSEAVGSSHSPALALAAARQPHHRTTVMPISAEGFDTSAVNRSRMMASASSNARRALSGRKKNQRSRSHDFHAEYEAGTSAEKGKGKAKAKVVAEASGTRKGKKRTRADIDDHDPPILGKNFNVIRLQEPSVLPKAFNVQVQMYPSLVCSLLNIVFITLH
jgi:hypothetical protein